MNTDLLYYINAIVQTEKKLCTKFKQQKLIQRKEKSAGIDDREKFDYFIENTLHFDSLRRL